MSLRVYLTDVSALENDALFTRLYGAVSPERQGKTDRLRFPKDKYLSLGAEYLLICACEDYGIDYRKASVLTDCHGKPFFKDIPLYFSLSHSGRYAMCAVSDEPVGCDIEEMLPMDDAQCLALAKQFLSPEDAREFEQLLDEPCSSDFSAGVCSAAAEAFYRLWTEAESFYKCFGKDFPISTKRDFKDCRFIRYFPEVAYSCCLCVKKDKTEISDYENVLRYRQIGAEL